MEGICFLVQESSRSSRELLLLEKFFLCAEQDVCVLGCKYFRYVSFQESADYFIDSLFSAYCLFYGREACLKCVLGRGDSDDCTRILNESKRADRVEIWKKPTRI